MPLEAAQLLSTALYLADPEKWELLHQAGQAYKPTHSNHPCAVWARACINNYLWLAGLGIELCNEYWYRFGQDKGRQHKSLAVLESLKANAPALPRARCITPFAVIVAEDCDIVGDPVGSYRRYYREHKGGIAKWTGRVTPEWMQAAP